MGHYNLGRRCEEWDAVTPVPLCFPFLDRAEFCEAFDVEEEAAVGFSAGASVSGGSPIPVSWQYSSRIRL